MSDYKKVLDENRTSIEELFMFLIKDSDSINELLKEMAIYEIVENEELLNKLKEDMLNQAIRGGETK